MADEKEKLMERYGWDGKRVSRLHSLILQARMDKIGERVLAQDKRRLAENLERIRPKTERGKKIDMPDASNIIRRSGSIIKAQEGGKLLRQDLREKLSQDLRAALTETGIETTRGTIPKAAFKKFKERSKKTFQDFTRRDPRTGIPPNLETFVTTEVTGYVENLREVYAGEVEKRTEGFEIEETWEHRPGLSKTKPRENHADMNGKRKKRGEKYRLTGKDGKTHDCTGPHDPTLPVSERINCHCAKRRRFVKA